MAALTKKRQLILAAENPQQLNLLPDNSVMFAGTLLELCHFLYEKTALPRNFHPTNIPASLNCNDNISDIIGQEQGKRALEICASGGHNLLLLGPPGTGKTMLASRLKTLLPTLTPQEALEVASIHSLCQSTHLSYDWPPRPFRAPHHSASMAALIGGGSLPKPGRYP